MNDNALGKMIVAGVAGGILVLFVQVYKHLKYSKTEEGKLHKRLDKKKTALSQISKYENTDSFVNKDLIESKKKELTKEIENDIIQYKLKANKEYIELENLKKQGFLDDNLFNQAVENIKVYLKENPNDKIVFIELENGEYLKVEQSNKETFRNSKLLSHLNLFENKLIKSGELILEISNNKIKNVFEEKAYDNDYVFAQKKSSIGYGDRLLKPSLEFQNELIGLSPFLAVRINKNIVSQVYWIKKGKTFGKKVIEIYQKSRNNRMRNDLVFINSSKAKDGFHLIELYDSWTLIRTKNGKIA